ncbi:UNVERIFIED_CONTAM: hypothetical protein K2H54_055588 [Gekko kuhli]
MPTSAGPAGHSTAMDQVTGGSSSNRGAGPAAPPIEVLVCGAAGHAADPGDGGGHGEGHAGLPSHPLAEALARTGSGCTQAR